MENTRKIKTISTRSLTRGALAIALTAVFFMFFKGVTNILNALLVPLTLFAFSKNEKYSGTFLIYTAVVITCALFFNLQLIFVVFYCAIAFILRVLITNKINLWVSVAIVSAASTAFFWVSILMTDYIFHTQMGSIMMKVFHGNGFLYFLMLAVEGILVGASLVFLSRQIDRRVALPKLR